MDPSNHLNVGKYTIHGVSGICDDVICDVGASPANRPVEAFRGGKLSAKRSQPSAAMISRARKMHDPI